MREGLTRLGAVARGELASTVRRPRSLLVLIVGPFLIMLAVGVGYDDSLPRMETVVVTDDERARAAVEEFLRAQEPAGIAYRGSTADREAALEALSSEAVDLVVVLPDGLLDSVARGRRSVIEVHHRSLHAVTVNGLVIATDIAVHRLNDAVMEAALSDLRAQLPQDTDQIGQWRDDLERLAALSGLSQLERLAATVSDLERFVGGLAQLDPQVAVRPLEADVVNQTPVEVTLGHSYALGLTALMLQHLGISAAALAFVRARGGPIDELLVDAPATVVDLAGRTLALLVLCGAVLAVLLALMLAVFGLPFVGNAAMGVLLSGLVLLASLGIGALAAAVGSTRSEAVQYALLAFLATIFFAGVFIPLERMDAPARLLAWLLPARYAFAGLQEIAWLGRTPDWTHFAGLLTIAGVSFAMARLALAHDPGRSSSR